MNERDVGEFGKDLKIKVCVLDIITPRHEINPMYYVYFIRNTKTGRPYLGYTQDLKRRLVEHSAKNPELLYYESYKAKTDARRREKMLKQRGQAIKRLKERIKDSLL